MSDALVSWLLLQIEEDERIARDADTSPVVLGARSVFPRAQMAHLTRWYPDRVLAECAAKRKMVETYIAAREVVRQDPTDIESYETTRVLEPLLHAGALVYTDRPGFDEVAGKGADQ